MNQQELLAVAGDFAIAILLGALVGIEREKRKAEEQEPGHIAGLRTFTLLALLGAAAGFLSKNLSSPWILAAALLIVGAFIVAGYFVTARSSDGGKGLTTETAAIVVFLLGAMVMFGERELAIALGVVTAAVLAYKQPLHGFVEKLGWDDVYAGLQAADRDLHRAAAPTQPHHRPVGRAQPLRALAARDPDLEPVACRLCADAMARAGEGNGADRIDGRARIVDRGHLVVRARSARQRRRTGAA